MPNAEAIQSQIKDSDLQMLKEMYLSAYEAIRDPITPSPGSSDTYDDRARKVTYLQNALFTEHDHVVAHYRGQRSPSIEKRIKSSASVAVLFAGIVDLPETFWTKPGMTVEGFLIAWEAVPDNGIEEFLTNASKLEDLLVRLEAHGFGCRTAMSRYYRTR